MKALTRDMTNPYLKFRACAVGIQVQGLHTVCKQYLTITTSLNTAHETKFTQ